MRLNEATEKLSPEWGEKTFWECVHNLATLGDDFILTSDDFEFAGWFDTTTLQGQTRFEGEEGVFKKQQVLLNGNMLRKGLEDMFINTCYHELLHVAYNKYFITHNLIGWDSNGMVKKSSEYEEATSKGGHAGKWLEWADLVTKEFGLVIPITPHCQAGEVEALLAANDDRPIGCIITCQNCQDAVKFMTFTPDSALLETPGLMFILMILYDTKYLKTNNFCGKCGGTLYINITDAEVLKQLEEMLDEHIGIVQMAHFFMGIRHN